VTRSPLLFVLGGITAGALCFAAGVALLDLDTAVRFAIPLAGIIAIVSIIAAVKFT